MNACFSPSASFRHSLQKTRPGISPQHLYGIVLPARPEQDGCFHLSRLLLPRDQTVRLVRFSGHAMIGNDETPGRGF